METRGNTPRLRDDTSDLAELVRAPGPFVTLVMTIDAAIDNASRRNQLRWRGLRDQLEADGAPAGALSAIEALIPEAHHGGQTLYVVADDSGTRYQAHWPALPFRELA